MTLCDENPVPKRLSPAESERLNSTDRRVPSEQKNDCIRERESVFQRKCGDDVALNVDQLEMHLPYFHASTFFERQDSLARAACLQECDRIRDPDGILDFLETTMNIEDYLEDIHMDDLPADGIDVDEIELQKCNNLCRGDQIETCSVDDSCFRRDVQKTPDLKPVIPKIKVEPDWEGNCPSTSSRHALKRERRCVKPSETYTPSTTARRYRLKTPQERNNALYKVKRQRNNDAVRRSRSKAKQLQLMKDKQLEEALLEIGELREKLRVASEKLSRCCCRK